MSRFAKTLPEEVFADHSIIRRLYSLRQSLLLCCCIHDSTLHFSLVNTQTRRPLRSFQKELLTDPEDYQELLFIHHRGSTFVGVRTDLWTLQFFSARTFHFVHEISFLQLRSPRAAYCFDGDEILVWNSEKVAFWPMLGDQPAAFVDFRRNINLSCCNLTKRKLALFQSRDCQQIFVVNTRNKEIMKIITIKLPIMVTVSNSEDYVFFMENIQFYETAIWELSCYRFSTQFELVFQEFIGCSDNPLYINVLEYEKSVVVSDLLNTMIIDFKDERSSEVRILDKSFPSNVCSVAEFSSNGGILGVLDMRGQIWLWRSRRSYEAN